MPRELGRSRGVPRRTSPPGATGGASDFAAGVIIGAAAALAVSHVLDLPYWINFLVTEVGADLQQLVLRLVPVPRPPRDPSLAAVLVTRHRVTPADLDRNLHMNNARYLRATNAARRRFWRSRPRLWRQLQLRQLNLVVPSTSIRYRRELAPFQSYAIHTRLVGASDPERSFYMEFRFMGQADFVQAVQLVQYRLIPKRRGLEVETPTALLREAQYPEEEIAALLESGSRPDLAAWRESLRASSRLLRVEAGLSPAPEPPLARLTLLPEVSHGDRHGPLRATSQ